MTKTNNNKWLNEQSQAHHVQRAKSELKIKNNNGIKREWKKGNKSTQQKSTTIYLCKSHSHTFLFVSSVNKRAKLHIKRIGKLEMEFQNMEMWINNKVIKIDLAVKMVVAVCFTS